MTKKLTKVAMTTALAAAAIVPAVVATPAQAAEAEVTFAKAYYSTANGTAAFEAGKLAGVISATTDTGITHLEASNGEVFTMSAFSGYLAVNPTATTDQVLTALSKAGKALSADQVKALNVKEGKVEGDKVTVDPTAVQKTALNEAIAKAEASPKAAELKDAIAAAKAVAAKADATQAEVDAAVKALNEAIAKAEAATELKVESVKAINGTSSVALDGATVLKNSKFEIVFNEEVKSSSVNNNTVKLMKGTQIVSISTIQTDKTVSTFTANSPLEAGATYTIVVDGVESAAGSKVENKTVATFTVADTSVVTSVKVAVTNQNLFDPTDSQARPNLATGFNSATGYFIVKLDEAVDHTTLTSQTVGLVDVTTGKSLSVSAYTNRDAAPYSTLADDEVAIKVVGTTDFLLPKNQYELTLKNITASSGKVVEDFNFKFGFDLDTPVVTNAYIDANTPISNVGTTNDSITLNVNPTLSQVLLPGTSVVKLAAKVSVDFGIIKAKLDESTINNNYIWLEELETETKVASKLVYNEALNRVEVSPVSALKESTEYRVVVSPYIKDIYGMTIGSKNTDTKYVKFKTLDVTAPQVAEVKVQDATDVNNFPLDKTQVIDVELSEAIASVSSTQTTETYAQFLAGANTAEWIVIDNKTKLKTTAVTVGATVVNDGKTLRFTVQVPNTETLRGESYSIVLAGKHPGRTTAASTIKDNSIVSNPLATDYTVSFRVEGDDVTAPSITSATAYQGAGNTLPVDLAGATNIAAAQGIEIALDDVAANVTAALGTPKSPGTVDVTYTGLVSGVSTKSTTTAVTPTVGTKNGKAVLGVALPATTPLTFDNGSYKVEVTVSGITDQANNESNAKKYSFVVGNGPKVATVTGVNYSGAYATSSFPTAVKTADTSFQVKFDRAVDRTTLTNANVKVYAGETEVPVSIKLDKLADNNVVLVPTEALKGNTEYKVVVSKDVKDAVGNSLRQVATLAPADYNATVKTVNDSAPVLQGTVTADETAFTFTAKFDQEVKKDTTAVLTLVNPTDATDTQTITGATYGNDDKDKTTLIFASAAATLKKDVNYKATLKVEQITTTSPESSTTAFDFKPTKDWAFLTETPLAVTTVNGAAVTGKVNVNADGVFNVVFDKPVRTSDVEKITVVNAATGAALTLNSNSVKAVDETTYAALNNTKAATTFKIDIPGVVAANTEYTVTLAKGAVTVNTGTTTLEKSNKKIELVVLSDSSVAALSVTSAATLGTIATDDTINIAEKGTSGFTVAYTGATVGATYNLKIAGTSVKTGAIATTAGTITLTAAEVASLASGTAAFTLELVGNDGGTPVASVAKNVTVDLNAPTIGYTSSSGGTNLVVTLNEDLYIGGSAVLDSATIPVSNFTLSDATKNITSATYNATAKTITFVIEADVADNATITANTTLTDKAGNPIASTVIGHNDASVDNKWEAIAD